MLESEARRKPDIAALLIQVSEMTNEEIDAAVVPLKWYREALKEAKRRIALTKIYDNRLPETEPTSVNLQRGLSLEYQGDNFWASARRGFQIEIRNGDLLFFPEVGGAWLNQVYFDNPPKQLGQSRRIKEQTRYEYLLDYLQKLNNNAVLPEQSPSHTTASGYGFSISK